jgi:hypothetical protein
MVDSMSALRGASQNFNDAVLRTTAAARGLSEPSQDAPDLSSSLVSLAASEKAFKAVVSAVGISQKMNSSVLDIVA